MWKKDDTPAPTPDVQPQAAPRVVERSAPAPTSAVGQRATIGRSIAIRGDVTGDEDLVIQGRIEGSVNLKQHSVTVGPEGEVKASVLGRIVTVEGRVEGDIVGDEQVILRSSARVQGDITAPRVVLEDGARFRGGIDMGEILENRGPAASETKRSNDRARSSDSSASGADVVASSSRSVSSKEIPAEVTN